MSHIGQNWLDKCRKERGCFQQIQMGRASWRQWDLNSSLKGRKISWQAKNKEQRTMNTENSKDMARCTWKSHLAWLWVSSKDTLRKTLEMNHHIVLSYINLYVTYSPDTLWLCIFIYCNTAPFVRAGTFVYCGIPPGLHQYRAHSKCSLSICPVDERTCLL